jgi:ABC-type branched-subunit amino acid transport system substrate-binding protein
MLPLQQLYTPILFICLTILGIITPHHLLAAPDAHQVPPSPTRSTINLYAAYGLSGDSKVHGKTDLNATKIAIADFSAYHPDVSVTLTVEDSASSDRTANTAIQHLMARYNTKIFLGPTWLDAYQAPIFLAKQHKLFFMSPSAATASYRESLGDYPHIFGIWIPLEQTVASFYRMLKQEGRKKLILITDQDPYIVKVRELLIALKPDEITIVSDHVVPSATTDFTPLIHKIKRQDHDALHINLGGNAMFLSFFQQVKKTRYTSPIYGPEYIEALSKLKEFSGLLNNVHYNFPDTSDEKLHKRYRELYNEDPEINLTYAYDAATILLEALYRGNNTPQAISSYLRSRSFPSKSYGTLTFDSLGSIVAQVPYSHRFISNNQPKVLHPL